MMETRREAGPPLLAFVGRSGSGKTTLLTRLIPVLAESGVRVGVVKHSPVHLAETDVPGRDTYRLFAAGASHVSLVAQDRAVHTHRFDEEPPLELVLGEIFGVDLVLLEGYKRRDVDKVEVVRRACDPVPIEGLARRIACVTDVEGLMVPCPRFSLEDAVGLADFVMGWLGERWRDGAVGGDRPHGGSGASHLGR
jgi:molybdopterin-guanine dinucleotide biosynthesis adapter protein